MNVLKVAKFTADEWQIFSDQLGSEIAAEKLNEALNKAVMAYFDFRRDKSRKEALREAHKMFLAPVMSEFSDYGAWDSEPRDFSWEMLDELT